MIKNLRNHQLNRSHRNATCVAIAALMVVVTFGGCQPKAPSTARQPKRDTVASDVTRQVSVPPTSDANRAGTYAVQQCQAIEDDGYLPSKPMLGVDGQTRRPGREPQWADQAYIPWETYGFGEYIGPHRTPHVPEYRVRINDQIEFVYLLTRERTNTPYRLTVGDVIEMTSATDPDINQTNVRVISDGSSSFDLIGRVQTSGKTIPALQEELNRRYKKFLNEPAIIVRGIQTDTRLQDLRDAVDARAGQGGQAFETRVAPDGTVQLPLVQSVPVVGLSLSELAREVNARYRERIPGIEVTPVLTQRAPRFIYVLGEVGQAGRVEMQGPTSVIQAISLAQGWNRGANLRNVIVFRRDSNWQLMATRLDLSGALHGRRPHPSDEIWLRDSDIVLVPKMPIQRFADMVNLYFGQSLYGIFPNQNFSNSFSNFSILF